MSQQNKDRVREFYEAVDSGNTAKIGQLCTVNAIFQIGSAPASSVAEFTQLIGGFANNSSRHVIRDLVAESDKVACHVDVVRNVDAGESVTKALTLFTFNEGKIESELVLLDSGFAG